jgi:hypothetical protein
MIQHAATCLKGPKSRQFRGSRKVRTGEIRRDLVARVRREIAAGTYDTPDKMEVALHRLLERHSIT